MSLVLEEGEGLPDAESFVSVADADTFWADRGIIAWTGLTEPAKEAALRQGFDYLGLAFRWPGQPKMVDQRGPFPRGMAFDRSGVAIPENSVPIAVVTANILLAFEATRVNLLQAATVEPALNSKQVKIGPITIQRDYDTGRQPRGLPRFPQVDAVISVIAGAKAVGGIRTQRLIRG